MTRKTTLKPAKLTTTRFKPRASALALGIPTLLMGSASFAQSEDAFVLDTLKIEERTLDTNPFGRHPTNDQRTYPNSDSGIRQIRFA